MASKTTELPAAAAVAMTDILAVVAAPDSAPASKKIAIADLLKSIQATTPNLTPFTIQGFAGQTADLMKMKDSAGNDVLRFRAPNTVGGQVHGIGTYLSAPAADHNSIFYAQFVSKGMATLAAQWRSLGLRVNGSDAASTIERTITGAVDNGAGFVRLQTSTTHTFAVGEHVGVKSVGGVTEANGAQVITAVPDNTHVDIGAAFVVGHVYTSGGTISNASMFSGAHLAISPIINRGGYSGTALHADDVAALTVHNTGSAKATDIIYNPRASGVTGAASATVLASEQDVDNFLYATGAIGYGLNLRFSTISIAAMLLPNSAKVQALNFAGTPINVWSLNTDDKVQFEVSPRFPNNVSVYARNNANTADVAVWKLDTLDRLAFQCQIVMGSGVSIQLSSTSGTMIGTAPTQKLGLWGTAATTQPGGWGAPTGTLTRTTFNTATVTLQQLAERVAAMITDDLSYGAKGT